MKTIRLAITMLCITVFSFAARAQYDEFYAFEKGKSILGVNVGVGLGNDSRTAVSASYEYGLANLFTEECVLGVGVFGGFHKDKLKNEVEKIYIVGTRLNVHYQFVERLDTYAGIDPNFNIRTYELGKDEAKFQCYVHIGGRYYLTNWLGVFAEMSTGYNNFSGGFSFKF